MIGEFTALITAILWSISSFIFTDLSKQIGSIQLNIYRMLLAALLIFITILILDIKFEISYYQLFFLIFSGIIGLLIGDTFLFKSFSLLGARIGMLIMSLNPGIAAIIAFFALSETLSIIGIIGIIITLIGISIVVLQKKQNDNKNKISVLGIIYAFLAAACQAVGLIFAKLAFIENDIDPFIATFIRLASATILFIPIGLIFKKIENPSKLFKNKTNAIKLLTGSFIGPYLGITLSFVAVTNAEVGIASTIMSTTPIIMLPIARFIYKEKLNVKAFVGAIIAVLGVALLFMR